MLIIFICVLCTLLMWKSGISAPFFSERVFITSIIIQYISVYIIFSNKNQPYSFKKITHIFVLFFLGIAPLLQYFNGVSFYGARKLFEYEYFYINLLILLILLIYNVTYPFFYKRKVSFRKIKEFKIIQVSKVRLKGVTNDIKKEYLNSSIYMMTSYTEAFPMVLLESMACGVPVIAYDCEGANEIVQNGVNGFLVESDNTEMYTKCLLTLIRDDKLRESFGKNAKQYSKKYNKENILKCWLNLFNQFS